jgi:hypothetical protein
MATGLGIIIIVIIIVIRALGQHTQLLDIVSVLFLLV